MLLIVEQWHRLACRATLHRSHFGQSSQVLSCRAGTAGASLALSRTASLAREAASSLGGAKTTVTAAWRRLHLVVLVAAAYSAVAGVCEETVAFLKSLPRTFRTVKWALQAGASYKAFNLSHPDQVRHRVRGRGTVLVRWGTLVSGRRPHRRRHRSAVDCSLGAGGCGRGGGPWGVAAGST